MNESGVDRDTTELSVTLPDRVISARVLTPRLVQPDPALIVSLALDRGTTLGVEPYNTASEIFLAAGHRSLCFDMPHHGERAGAHGQGLAGIAAAMRDGEDVYGRLAEEGRAVVDACIARGLARPGRIVVCGTSRGGHAALHLAAADGRIAGVAAFAPVTYLPALSEFADLADNALVQKAGAIGLVSRLVGRHVWIAIGHADDRVDTDRCLRFVLALRDAERAAGIRPSRTRLFVTEDQGHGLLERDFHWFRRGGEFLRDLPG